MAEVRALIDFMVLERGFMTRGPVFVVGCGHSGTSASLALLARAPHVHAIEGESRLFLFRRPGIRHEFSSLVSRKAFSKLRDASRHARANGGIWVEKTPGHVRVTNRIQFWIPNCRFIGIWRDPLDVVPSLMGRGLKLDQAIARWVQDNSSLVQMVKNGKKVHLLRFENLIESPKQTVSGINAFLGLVGENAVPIPEPEQPPQELPSREDHAARRAAQIASGFYDSRRVSARNLPKPTRDFILRQTAPILADLDSLSKPGKIKV